MTQSNAASSLPQETVRNDHFPDCLLHLLLNLLAPMFLLGSDGDIHLARMAALGTIDAYRARDNADLIAVAQIVAFGLATLGSLSLSMADDLSLNMILRLRGNANACDRSAERNRQALRQGRPAQDPPHPEVRVPPPPVPPSPRQEEPSASAAHPPAMMHDQAVWAAAMATVAEEYAAELPTLPPEERKLAAIRVNALNYCINELQSGIEPPPPDPATTRPASRA